MLVQVLDLRLSDGGLDGDRREGVVAPEFGNLSGQRPRRHVQDMREPSDEPCPASLGHISDRELHRGSRDVRHHEPSVSVEDRATRSLDPDEPQLVVLGGGEIVRAREHLQ